MKFLSRHFISTAYLTAVALLVAYSMFDDDDAYAWDYLAPFFLTCPTSFLVGGLVQLLAIKSIHTASALVCLSSGVIQALGLFRLESRR
ncbi:SCO4225 family membrane protein [Limnoglobus roseus]|uniref:SCO4225 family membrane protein n=1 Tax=Limnoglobus roseus TaxID=2598579 RepID=UPI0011EABC20|nr:hypothetical protein [Limnoglobus roseus]